MFKKINLRDIKLTGSADYFLKLFKQNEKEISKVIITDAVINKIPRYLKNCSTINLNDPIFLTQNKST